MSQYIQGSDDENATSMSDQLNVDKYDGSSFEYTPSSGDANSWSTL